MRRRGFQIAQLRREALAAVAYLRIFFRCEQVDRAHRIETPLQARDLPLRLLPVDLLDCHGVIFDFLAALAERLRAAIDFGLRRLAVGTGSSPGVIRVGELDLQRDIALFVLAELGLQGGERLSIGKVGGLEGTKLRAQPV